MATLAKGKTFTATEQVTAAKLHQLIDSGTVSAIVNADCASGMALADTKLAQITTANKVASTAITDGALDIAALTCDSVTSAGAISGTTIAGSTVGCDTITVTTNHGLILTEGSAVATAAGTMALYTKDTSGQPELFCREESSGDEVQVTSGGSVTGGSAITEYVIKGWASITVTTGTPTLDDSYNVTSITDIATGQVTITWATDFGSVNYAPIAVPLTTGTESSVITTIATGTVLISNSTDAGDLADPQGYFCIATGDQ